MKDLVGRFLDIWKNNYIFRTFVSSSMATIVGFGFIIFNGVFGLMYKSLWHGTICIYYILLTTVRGIIVFCMRKERDKPENDRFDFRISVSRYTHILLFVLNVSLVAPISLMVKGDREYEFGLIPAIAMAAYTTYRIIFSSINLKKVKMESNCLVRELRVINMIDTLVAILSMQNALIIANDGDVNGLMLTVSIFSSAVIFVFIVIITIRSMIINTN